MAYKEFRISVVGIVMVGRNVLLVKKKEYLKKPLSGKWALPGGPVENFRSPAESLEHILERNLGIKARVDGLLDAETRFNHYKPNQIVCSMFFEVTPPEITEIIPLHKWNEACWISKRNVFSLLSEEARSWLPLKILEMLMV